MDLGLTLPVMDKITQDNIDISQTVTEHNLVIMVITNYIYFVFSLCDL